MNSCIVITTLYGPVFSLLRSGVGICQGGIRTISKMFPLFVRRNYRRVGIDILDHHHTTGSGFSSRSCVVDIHQAAVLMQCMLVVMPWRLVLAMVLVVVGRQPAIASSSRLLLFVQQGSRGRRYSCRIETQAYFQRIVKALKRHGS